MKEHPDYKYRPRRKPKAMVQKKEKEGSVGRTVETVGNKLSSTFLPPYPLYPDIGRDVWSAAVAAWSCGCGPAADPWPQPRHVI